MLWKCCTQYASKFGKLSSAHWTGKGQFYSNPKERQCQRMLKLCSKSAQTTLKECTIALISHASKVMFKILQARLQQYVNRELPDVQASFRKYITICRIDSQCKFPVWCRELKPILYDNLEGGKVGSGREVQEVWTYVYIWLIHVDIWQKPTQYCKAIIPQLNKFVKKEVFWFHQFFVPQYKEGPYLSIVSQFRMKLHKFETYLSHLSNKEI